MSQGDKPFSMAWAARADARADKPRFVFGEHMVAFAPDGPRCKEDPEKLWPDGYRSVSEPFYLASAEELHPKNEKALKAKLLEAISHAREEPMSRTEMALMKHVFARAVVKAAVEAYPVAMARYFAQSVAEVKAQFNEPEQFRRLAKDEYCVQDLFDGIMEHYQDSVKAYTAVRQAFYSHEKQQPLHNIEEAAARKMVDNVAQFRGKTPLTAQRIMDACVKRTNDNSMVLLSPQPLRILRNKLINAHYADLDKTLERARRLLAHNAQENDRHGLYEHTEEELKLMQHVKELATREHFGAEVMRAGYDNPKLTIVLNSAKDGRYRGVSFEGQDRIRVAKDSRYCDFDSTIDEELMHQGIDKIYNNGSLPYRDNHDTRKILLERAIKSDTEGKDMVYSRLGVSKGLGYNPTNTKSMHKEIPVKMLQLMESDRHEGDMKLAEEFPKLREFVEKVLIPDAKAFRAGQPLPDVDEHYNRTTRHAARAAAPREGWKLE